MRMVFTCVNNRNRTCNVSICALCEFPCSHLVHYLSPSHCTFTATYASSPTKLSALSCYDKVPAPVPVADPDTHLNRVSMLVACVDLTAKKGSWREAHISCHKRLAQHIELRQILATPASAKMQTFSVPPTFGEALVVGASISLHGGN